MKLWRRASGAFKDQNSLLVANLSKESSCRNPHVEAAIIKATSHNERHVDYRNSQRVLCWLRTSPESLKPLIWSLTTRMEKTQSWVVAIKGLMLMHGVFCCNTPAVQTIGRLPFDLSNFSDGHSKSDKMWGYNAFVRSYFLFLDQRSTLLYSHRKQTDDHPMTQELRRLQNWQSLLDTLLEIKPLDGNMKEALILEAMDFLIVEVFDVYIRICNGIAKVLTRIHSAGKPEAAMVLEVLRKAKTQAEDLVQYFNYCEHFGALNAKEVPKITQISETDIHDLERTIGGVSRKKDEKNGRAGDDNSKTNDASQYQPIIAEQQECKANLKTIITEKWEVFEDQNSEVNPENGNPYRNHPSYVPVSPGVDKQDKTDIPDLITF